jgi:transcriptional regulator with XRE-family HTH domain
VTERKSEPLAVVIGHNFRRLRTEAGLTQNDLAKHAKVHGLRWTASKVGDFESGRTAPTFATVLAATEALSRASKRNVSLSELVESQGFVEITDKFDPTGTTLAAILSGQRTWEGLARGEVGYYARTPLDMSGFRERTQRRAAELERYPEYGKIRVKDLEPVFERQGLDEQRVAKRLEISAELLAAVSWTLWRRSFSDERDRRAGGDANAQKRGRVSRELQAELRGRLDRGNDQ